MTKCRSGRMRSAVEKQLDLIAQGKAEQKAVLEHALRIFTSKFMYFMNKIQYMDELFEATFSKLSETGRPLRCIFATHGLVFVTVMRIWCVLQTSLMGERNYPGLLTICSLAVWRLFLASIDACFPVAKGIARNRMWMRPLGSTAHCESADSSLFSPHANH